MIPFDGRRLLAIAREIAVPRRAGSAGDGRVRALVAGRLRTAGLELEIEPFSYDLGPAERALRALLGGAAVVVTAAGALIASQPLIALALLVAAFLPGALFLGWSRSLEKLYRGDGPTHTANVVARRPASHRRLTIVLVAHHDSKAQSLSLPMRVVLSISAVAAVAGMLALVAMRLASGAVPGAAVLATSAAAIVALLGLASMRSNNRSPGGVDNAGSVAILLELARTLPAELPADVELVVLATGAEEDHMVGAMRWLDRHAQELDEAPALCCNLDGAGAPGSIALLDRYGFGRAFSPRLSRAAVGAAGRLGLAVRRVLMPPGLGIDAIPFARRGIESITLASGSLGRATLAVHSARDVADNLDPEALARVAALARELVLDLAAPQNR